MSYPWPELLDCSPNLYPLIRYIYGRENRHSHSAPSHKVRSAYVIPSCHTGPNVHLLHWLSYLPYAMRVNPNDISMSRSLWYSKYAYYPADRPIRLMFVKISSDWNPVHNQMSVVFLSTLIFYLNYVLWVIIKGSLAHVTLAKLPIILR